MGRCAQSTKDPAICTRTISRTQLSRVPCMLEKKQPEPRERHLGVIRSGKSQSSGTDGYSVLISHSRESSELGISPTLLKRILLISRAKQVPENALLWTGHAKTQKQSLKRPTDSMSHLTTHQTKAQCFLWKCLKIQYARTKNAQFLAPSFKIIRHAEKPIIII